MDHSLTNDEHHEDQLPPAPHSPLIRRANNDNEDNNQPQSNRSSRLLENWRNLYETSLHSLQSDDNDQSSFSINRQVTPEKPPSVVARVEQRPYSPLFNESEFESNKSKSKWEIRLPTLLNTTVGPDRQASSVTRRHTTNVVFQPWNSENIRFNANYPSQTANGTDLNQSISPLVKQLKLKFDRMILSNLTNNISQTSATARPRLHRVASLTSRGSSANTSERLIQKPRSELPIRPSDKRTSMANGRGDRGRVGPPISYSRHHYPPASATSVVKQIISAGATMVYDSGQQKAPAKAKPLVIKRQQTLEETKTALQNTDVLLTGRQLVEESSDDDAKPRQTIPERRSNEKNIREPISRGSSISSSESKSNSVPPNITNEASDIYEEPERISSVQNRAPKSTEPSNRPLSIDDTGRIYLD